MRRVLLLAAAGMLALAGAAYAAAVTPKYILHAKVTPVKSGTATHAVPSGAQLSYTVTTSPPGHRPPVVQGYRFYFQGIRANLKYFPACSTSTLNGSGPTGCRKGSQIGTGSFTVALGTTGTTTTSGTCVADLSIWNGGGSTLIFYVFRGTEANACPLPDPGTFTITVRLSKAHKGRDLVENFSVPTALRHPTTGIDAAVIKATTTVNKSMVIKTTKVGKKKVKLAIGLFESTYCPPNHQRNVQATFTPEGQATGGRLATTHAACR